MNHSDIIRLYERRGYKIDEPFVVHQFPEAIESSDKDSKSKVLQELFAIDPLSGKPMNDLVLSANQRLDPTIREFIRQNLQAPVEPQKATSDYGISEDLCRKSHETVFEYQQRLREMSVDGIEYIKEASKKISHAKSK